MVNKMRKALLIISIISLSFIKVNTPTIQIDESGIYTLLIFPDSNKYVRANLYFTTLDSNEVQMKWILDGTNFGDSDVIVPSLYSLPSNYDITLFMINQVIKFDSLNNVNIQFKD